MVLSTLLQSLLKILEKILAIMWNISQFLRERGS